MRSKIQERVSQNNGNEDKAFVISVIRIMHEFKMSYTEVLLLPIPAYLELRDFIIESDNKKNGKK
jgi:hypothetical protein